jgi:hypothetical protein
MRSVTHTTQVPISGPHGTTARRNDGCSCTVCRRAHSENARVRKRARAQERLPADLRQQLLDAIHAGQPFRTVLRELGLTSDQVWGLTKSDHDWPAALEAALTATGGDLQHGTNTAYAGLCLQGLQGAPAGAHGQESRLADVLAAGEHEVGGGVAVLARLYRAVTLAAEHRHDVVQDFHLNPQAFL